MNTITIRDFRSKMASAFDKTDLGEKVFIRRKKRLYTIVPVDTNEIGMSPELLDKIEKARKEFRNGETLGFSNAASAQKWMDEL